MRELTDTEILNHLRNNTIQRNHQLSVLIKFLNSLNANAVIAIDGAWGSGKTVFIKQLRMLADDAEDIGFINSIDQGTLDDIRTNQKTFYFNAWENDHLDDALSAVLLKLIADADESLTLEAIKRGAKLINISAGIKNISHDFIDLDAKTHKDELVEDAKKIVDRHDAVNEFLDDIKGDAKRLVFVIDELDRCRPSFAVELLEVIKHYFTRDDITFIVTTNIKQLSHTIQKYYGYNFDGYAYLNKFFDFTIGLRKIDLEAYARRVLAWQTNSYVVHEVAHDAIHYYGLEMREINTYHSSLRLIDNFLSKNNNWSDDQYPIQLIFVPLALALKIKSNLLYTDLVTGKGERILKEFMPNTQSGLNYAQKLVPDRTNSTEEQLKEKAIDALVVEYKNLFIPEGRRRGQENLQDFYDAISLISSYTTLPSREDEQ